MTDTQVDVATFPAPLDIDPKMIVEIAQGIEDAKVIATRYGLSPATWTQLRKHHPFRMAVAQKMAELKASGYTFRMRAGLMADELLDQVFLRAKSDTVDTEIVLKAAQWMAKMGQLEPQEKGAQIGTGFSVQILLGNGSTEVKVSPDGKTASIGAPA